MIRGRRLEVVLKKLVGVRVMKARECDDSYNEFCELVKLGYARKRKLRGADEGWYGFYCTTSAEQTLRKIGGKK